MNKTQWNILVEIASLFASASIDFWLRGGWALDFLLGRITRPHEDIDLVIWRRDAEAAGGLLCEHGFTRSRELPAQIDFVKLDQEVSIVCVAQNEAGRIYPPGIDGWIWLEGVLDHPPQRLADLECRVLSPQQLLATKLGYEAAKGRPLRPKDYGSIEKLRAIIDSA
jgi:hypothetical protein